MIKKKSRFADVMDVEDDGGKLLSRKPSFANGVELVGSGI